ncbi:MAG TPA: PqqD family protein [Solirubrobacteraceae bacterium]|nr:PqqD family protein [Solirubrobacteraceae bacterium]
MSPHSAEELLAARVRLPQHIVHRSFVAETVVLNLRTGKYHGLNPTAGKMLEAIDAADTVAGAVPGLAQEYGLEQDQIERDLVALCAGLLERGLIEIVEDDGKAGTS